MMWAFFSQCGPVLLNFSTKYNILLLNVCGVKKNFPAVVFHILAHLSQRDKTRVLLLYVYITYITWLVPLSYKTLSKVCVYIE